MTNNNDMATRLIKDEIIILGTELMMGLILPESFEWKAIVALTLVISTLTCIGSVIVDKQKER